MRALTIAVVAIAAILTGCAKTPPLPAATVSTIDTIAVVVGSKKDVRVSHRGFTVFNNDGTRFDAADWGIVDLEMAALRRRLEPRFKVIAVPATPVDEDDLVWSSYSRRVENIVSPALAGSGVSADVILFLDILQIQAFPGISWKFSGCGIYDVGAFSDKTYTRAYCVSTLHLIDPKTMEDIARAPLTGDGDVYAAVEVLPDFGFTSVHLTPEQIETAKKGITAALDRAIPVALQNMGLIP